MSEANVGDLIKITKIPHDTVWYAEMLGTVFRVGDVYVWEDKRMGVWAVMPLNVEKFSYYVAEGCYEKLEGRTVMYIVDGDQNIPYGLKLTVLSENNGHVQVVRHDNLEEWTVQDYEITDLKVESSASQPEYTGGSVNYYKVGIKSPTTKDNPPYVAECNDIIEALDMNYAEGNAFKALWRRAAARKGLQKRGYTDGLYDAEKVVFFGKRLVEQEKEKQHAED